MIPRPVTITADNKTRPVNTPNPQLTGTVVNVVPGQSITATFSTTATTASPAGAYPITPAYIIGAGTKASNYAITVVNGTLTITSSGSGGGGGGEAVAAEVVVVAAAGTRVAVSPWLQPHQNRRSTTRER